MTQKQCPCRIGTESELTLAQCCQPFIAGKKKPETAEQLLRSRYTAFATNAIDYILATHHSKTRGELNRDEIEGWAKESKWLGFKLIENAPQEIGPEKTVLYFQADYVAEGKHHEHMEKSLFEKEDGEWRFVDAQGLKMGPIRRTEPKMGRNDPCACGSGKKFKKCCAAA